MTIAAALLLAQLAAPGKPLMGHGLVTPPSSSHLYFNALIARSDIYRAWSLRPVPGSPGSKATFNPYWEGQLRAKNQGGLHASDCDPVTADQSFKYLYGTDTDPEAQDGVRAAIPAFAPAGICVSGGASSLAQVIDADDDIFTATVVSSTYTPGRAMKIDSEIMRLRVCTVEEGGDGLRAYIAGTKQFCVIRAQYSTVAAPHIPNTIIKISQNSMANYLAIPVNPTEDGYTYLITWDAYHTAFYTTFSSWDAAQKTYQLTDAGNSKMYEPRLNFTNGGHGGVSVVPGFNPTQHVGVMDVRSYVSLNTGQATWAETNGRQHDVTVINHTPLLPRAAAFIVKPSVWVRYWIRVRQKANDWDEVSLYAADEHTEPVLIYNNTKTSVGRSLDPNLQSMREFWFAMGNSSEDFNRPGDIPYVIYFRNWAMLKWTHAAEPADLAAAGLMQKPVR